MTSLPHHLPTTQEELSQRGWSVLDVILVTGDAHVDHPAFPANLLGRVLEEQGLRVGIIARPRVDRADDLKRLGQPRLFFGVSSGALDSMVANYTALKKRRSDDAYAPGGKAGGRPDRALTVYCQSLRRAFGKSVFIVAGGLEASLRRFAHYDYWSDKVRRSILMDCGADVLIHGMGEGPVVELAKRLDGLSDDQRSQKVGLAQALADMPGLVYRQPASAPTARDMTQLPSAEQVATDPRSQARAQRIQEQSRHLTLSQKNGGMLVIANPAWRMSGNQALDDIYALPFRREVHPIHGGLPVPALEQVRFSVSTHRGCFGGCSFCAIGAHQGRDVTSRSPASVLAETERISAHPKFRGTVPDMGGPSANMYGFSCGRIQRTQKTCRRVSCLWPTRCKYLTGDQKKYADLLKRASRVQGVRHLHVTTGIRLDLAMECPSLVRAIARNHTSGLLKVAPEHLDPQVLKHMRKPGAQQYDQFCQLFQQASAQAGKKQFVLPYLMAAHPGTSMEAMIDLAVQLRSRKTRVEQVQIFTPTPGSAATVMYSTGLDPVSLKPVFVERKERRKRMHKALLLSHLPENQTLVEQALKLCGRTELSQALRPSPKSLSRNLGPGKKTVQRRKQRKKQK